MPRRSDLGAAGAVLWKSVSDDHDLTPVQQTQLVEACRTKDRLEDLHAARRSDPTNWRLIASINSTLSLLNQTLAALRLPDEATGKKPQRRGAPRGSYGNVSSIERARSRGA